MLFPIGPRVGLVAASFTLLCAGALALGAGGCKRDTSEHGPAPMLAEDGGKPLYSVVFLKPSEGDLATLLPAAVAKAKTKNLKTFVELRADWCGPCKELEASMTDPRMLDAFKGASIVRLDVDEWSGKLKPLGLESSSIPVFFEVDDQGKATGRKITGGAWAENIPANMAPPLKAFFAGK